MAVSKHKVISLLVILLIFPVVVFLSNQPVDLIRRAYKSLTGSKANLVINLTDSYPRSNYIWQNLAQGGEQRSNTFDAVVNEVSLIEPEYIRIDHIYDFYGVVERQGDSLVFHWGALDHEVNKILETGAKPFLSLSYMPAELSTGSEVDTPGNWDEWRLLVQKTIEHYSGRDGMAIEGVYYEVWNEPDLFGEFKLYGDKNYLELYRYSALGARSAENVLPFKFGGPATTNLMHNWLVNFLDFTLKNDLRVDFYSWHVYSKYLDQYERDRIKAREWLLNFPHYSDLELIITETGINSEHDKAYDNELSAIHTIAVAAAMDGKIDRIFNFEVKDGPGGEKYKGRWGILSHEEFGEPLEKPRYRAFEFLNQMQGERYVIYGNGTWVKSFSSKVGDTIKVLLVNYDPFNLHSENVPINFVNLPFNEFRYVRRNFLGGVREEVVSVSENNWTVNEIMTPNSAAILELYPIE